MNDEVAAHCVRFARVERALLLRGGGVAAVTALVFTLLAHTGAGVLLAPVGTLVLSGAHYLLLAATVIGPTFRVLRLGPRRLLARTLIRLGFLTIGLSGYGALITPWLNIVVVPLTTAFLTVAVTRYCAWLVEAQEKGTRITAAEWLALAVLLSFVGALVVAFIATGALVGWLVGELTRSG